MESTLKEIFKELTAELSAKLPEIKHIDWFNDQYGKTTVGNDYFGYRRRELRERNELPFLTPAVLFDFDKANYEGVSTHIQSLTIRLHLHLVTENYQDSRMTASDREQHLDRINLLQNLANVFHGFVSRNVFSLKRTESKLDHQQGNTVADVLVFELRTTERMRFVTVKTPVVGGRVQVGRGL